MGLLQRAYETYENMKSKVGVVQENKEPLCPISHIIQRAQIEVQLTAEGKFVSAFSVAKDDCKTIIPATESSAGRAGLVLSPHPLCDNLMYLSGERLTQYMQTLQEWNSSPYTHPTVQAVCNYMETDALLEDLSKAGLITVDTAGQLEKGKLEGVDFEKCLVRWVILRGGNLYPCWKDQTLFEKFEKYYAAKKKGGIEEICMVSGKRQRYSQNHPKGVVSKTYGAKLISANDKNGFTYRGRFLQPEQAVTVGYESSQKAHNALHWVVTNHGVTMGNRTFVAWNPKGLEVPPPTSAGLLWDFLPLQQATSVSEGDYYEQLKKALDGSRNALPDDEDVVLAAFDAATQGRLSVVYYGELKASDFRSRLGKWYASCVWEYGKFGIQSPPLWAIIGAAFGSEKDGRLETDEKVFGQHYQRLFHCIVDGSMLPTDIIMAAAGNASNPLAYSVKCRNQVLDATCAIVRKYRNERAKKEEWILELDRDNSNRSYLFGRLLAIAEKIERDTYGTDEKREPNAVRYQVVFSQRPLSTWRNLQESLLPYIQRLNPGKRMYYRRLIDEIVAQLPSDATLNHKLEDVYLLGYSHQRNALYAVNTDATNHDNDKNEEE